MDMTQEYYACYRFFLNYVNQDVSYIIINYIFAKCVDCNDSYHYEFYECKCGKLRCIHHTYLKTIIVNDVTYCNECKLYDTDSGRIFIKCIICDRQAHYGYKDLVCYCEQHIIFKKCRPMYTTCQYYNCINVALQDGACCLNHKNTVSYIDTTISIRNINGTTCSFCNTKYVNMRHCECSSYCTYCFVICVWCERNTPDGRTNVYVCNNCYSQINISDKYYIPDRLMICHEDNCIDNAEYIINGTLLYCKKHSNNDPMSPCIIEVCCKFKIGDMYCYDHVSKHFRTKIDYILKN